MRFCCKTENITKSAQFGLKMFRSFELRKRVPTLYVSDHKQRSYLSLKLPKHGSFHSFCTKRTVRASLSRMSKSACVF